TVTTSWYVTTFWTVWPTGVTEATLPLNRSFGQASTVNETAWPGSSPPMSDSLTWAWTVRSARSARTMNDFVASVVGPEVHCPTEPLTKPIVPAAGDRSTAW